MRHVMRTVLLALSVGMSNGGAAVFTDAALRTPGLVGSYVNRSLEMVTNVEDWRLTQPIAGTRIDTNFARRTADWGSRAAVGITGGTGRGRSGIGLRQEISGSR